jgi:hypothetical protein
MYVIQHCFICLPSDSTVLEDVGIEPRTVAPLALTARRSIHSARSQILDLVFFLRFPIPQNAIHEKIRVFLFRGFICMDF